MTLTRETRGGARQQGAAASVAAASAGDARGGGALREKLRVEHGTTLPRFDVMSALSRNPDGLKMSELSGVLRVSNGNVTGIIERLVEEGHVTRSAVDGDRRAFSVRLTDKGRAEFARQAAEHEAWIDAALSAISAEDAGEITWRLGALTKREG